MSVINANLSNNLPLDFDEAHFNNAHFNYFLDAFINNIQLQNLNLNNLEDVKVVLSKTQFNRLKHKKLTEKLNDDCSICLENIDKDEEITFLKCSHKFHKNCAIKWLCETAVTCPICRSDTRETLRALESYTVVELKKMAKESGLKRYSRLRKHELIKLLN
jgi:hypothetical protein